MARKGGGHRGMVQTCSMHKWSGVHRKGKAEPYKPYSEHVRKQLVMMRSYSKIKETQKHSGYFLSI